jgi:hypothetical protein
MTGMCVRHELVSLLRYSGAVCLGMVCASGRMERLISHCYRRRLWMGPGAKLKDAQLYGYPTIIVVGTHTQHDDNLFEVQDRSTGKSEVLHFNDLLHRLGR